MAGQDEKLTPTRDIPLGFFSVKLDESARIKLPSRLRNYLNGEYTGERIYVTSFDGKIGRLLPARVYHAKARSIGELQDRTLRKNLQDRASYFGQDTDLDAAGRFSLKDTLRQRLRLDPGDPERQYVHLMWRDEGIDILENDEYQRRIGAIAENGEADVEAAEQAGVIL